MYKFNSGNVMPIMGNDDFSDQFHKKDNLKKLTDEVNNEINVENSINLNDTLFIDVSNDIRSPLNVIYSAAQLIELYLKIDEENENTDKIAANINTIKQNGYKLMKTLNNILDLQKIKVGLFSLNYSYANIVEVVEEVVEGVAEMLKDKQLTIIFDTDTEEEYMMVDIENIARVMLNIMSYAVKFLNPGGIVNVKLTAKNKQVKIAVTFKGNGMDNRNLEDIFNSDVKMDKSLSEIGEGKHIGLRLSKLLVGIHGGYINYTKTNNGNSIIVKLPRKINNNIYTLYNHKVINNDSLDEMIKIEFSDVCIDEVC